MAYEYNPNGDNVVKIFIDKGHGGDDPGAGGNGMQEADIVDVIGDYLVEELKSYVNVSTKLGPRPKGHTGSERLTPRTVAANQWDANFFVSLHINAGGGTGSETLVGLNASSTSKRIAGIVNREVANLFAANSLPDRGVKSQNVHVLRESNMPAILIEFGFIDRDKDAALLKTDAFRKKCAQAAAKGIADALGLVKEKSHYIPAVDTPTVPIFGPDGKKLIISGILINGTTYLPARILGQFFKVNVGFKNGHVVIGDHEIEDTIVINGTGYGATREAATAFGFNVQWDGKAVHLNHK